VRRLAFPLLALSIAACGGDADPADAVVAFALPGLTPDDVTEYFEERGLACGEVALDASGEPTCQREGPDGRAEVFVMTRTPGAVETVNVHAYPAGGALSADLRALLLDAAALPYRGADPEEARAWVADALPAPAAEGSRTQIGPAQFMLVGTPGARILSVSPAP
jgi:hypothetical protein